MKRLLSLGIVGLGGLLMIGCNSSNEFTPASDPTQLSAYAAKNPYPVNPNAKDNPQLTALVNPHSGAITVRNFGSGAIENFKLWVNQIYVLHVDRLDPQSSRVFHLADLYNSGGNSMKDLSAEDVHKVQVETADGQIWNVQGPQME